MPPKKSNTLTEAELRLMKILWRRGESAVTDLVADLPDGETLAYNSVLTTIRILEQKGYVEHRQEGRAFVYRPCIAEQEASRSEVRHILNRFFGNSRERLLLSLLGDEADFRRGIAAAQRCHRRRCARRAKIRHNEGGLAHALFLFANALHEPLSHAGRSLLADFKLCAQFATPAAFTAVWQGIAVAFALSVALKFAPHISAAQRFKLWAAAFVATFALPFAPLVFAILPSAHPSARFAAPVASAPHAWLQLDPRWSFWFAGLWLMASVARTFDLLLNRDPPAQLLESRPPRQVPRAAWPFHAPSKSAPPRNSIDPASSAFLHPRILIPDWLLCAPFTPEELDQIVLHESEHLHRHDDWTNLLQKLCLVLFPINPSLWFIERQLARESEMACDETVVRITESPRAYAACLASLAERDLQRRAEALSLGAWQRRPELVHRIHRILHHRKTIGPAAARVSVAVFICGLAVVSLELARCPQLVAFVPATVPDSTHPAESNMQAAQLGDAVYPSMPDRSTLPSGIYALPAKAVMPDREIPKLLINRARQQATQTETCPSWRADGLVFRAEPDLVTTAAQTKLEPQK